MRVLFRLAQVAVLAGFFYTVCVDFFGPWTSILATRWQAGDPVLRIMLVMVAPVALLAILGVRMPRRG